MAGRHRKRYNRQYMLIKHQDVFTAPWYDGKARAQNFKTYIEKNH